MSNPAIPRAYRKRPLTVLAMCNDGTPDMRATIVRWVNSDGGAAQTGGFGAIVIDTLEGRMTALEGDWVIQGVKGEFYPCKPDIFEATYEEEAT